MRGTATRRTRALASAAWLSVLLLASLASAQGGPAGSGGGGPRIYDKTTVETIAGEVVRVEKFAPGKKAAGGVHLVLKTDKEEIAVHLGPRWYVEEQAVEIAAEDRIEVRGSRISIDGEPAILAAEVKKGDQVLKLRDDAGLPLWRGSARRKR
jgi:hypothetical protein